MAHASCLCRGVSWEADGPFQLMSHCHCSRCRKAHGVAFATYVMAPRAGFRVLSGADLVREYQSSPGMSRPFCGRCGSVVFGEGEGDLVVMPAGCLDDDPGVQPLAHIFTASKAPWWEIADELPQFDTLPEGFGEAPSLAGFDHTEGSRPGEVVRGSCLCGATAYEVTADLDLMICCHCSRCRKARAAAHGANVFAPPETFRWLRGEDDLDRFPVPGADFTHTFCKTCGSSMPRVGERFAVLPAGSIDGDPGTRPKMHIYLDSKAPWYDPPDDGVVKHLQGPGSPPVL